MEKSSGQRTYETNPATVLERWIRKALAKHKRLLFYWGKKEIALRFLLLLLTNIISDFFFNMSASDWKSESHLETVPHKN